MAQRAGERPGGHVLIWLVMAIVPAFAATAVLSRAYHAEERALSSDWRARGERALAIGDPAGAADAFRTALTFARDDFELRLDLARALSGSQRFAEARAYLLTLRDEQPGDGPVNLALGRLAIQQADAAAAIRYYHDAIEGAWATDPERARRGARLELAEFLVRRRVTVPAQAELISLAADLPDDPALKEHVGRLMIDAEMPSRALPLLRSVMASRPSAAAAAGRAAFALGQDALAERYLAAARARGDADRSLADMLEILQLSRDADPLSSGLSSRERLARSRRDLEAARARHDACDASQPADAAALMSESDQLRSDLGRARVADPDLLERTMALVLRLEAPAEHCASATPLDRALLRVARRRQSAIP